MSRLLYAERQGDNPPRKVNAGAVWLEYSQDKNAQAVSGCAQLRVIPTTPPPDRGLPPGTGAKPSLPAMLDILEFKMWEA